MLRQFVAAVSAGIMIAIGGCVYLAAESRVVGAVFFSVALLSICYKGYGLFTGRVGYFPERFSLPELEGLGMTLLGNAVATIAIGTAVCYLMPAVGGGTALSTVAAVAVGGKLAMPWYSVLLRAVLCGILMYLAVSIYREKNTVSGIFFCVPTFILAGFEHSIADMFYVAAAGELTLDALAFLVLVIGGNAIGGMLLPLLSMIGKEKETAPKTEEAAE